jgi:prepilin-type N-terminal cleavage/methylation domain-containing protein
MKRAHPIPRGFTLLEMLIAVTLLAALLLCLNQFAFSMAELWGQGTERRRFERHASAVTRHLQCMLQEAAHGLEGRAPVAISDVLAGSGGEVSLVMELPGGDRVFATAGEPPPAGVICAVRAQAGKGLLLDWRAGSGSGFPDQPKVLVLSPFGERMDYEYYDRSTGRWAARDHPVKDAEGRWMTPDRLRLHFVRGALRTLRTAYVDRPEAGLPAF